jgi:hypothetical protein
MNLAAARFWAWFDRCMTPRVPASRLGAFRALVCAVALYDVLLYSGLVLHDAARLSAGEGSRPWTPIYLFQLLGVRPVGIDAARVLFAVAIVSLTCGALGVLSRWSCAVGAVAFFWWTGLAYSFGKPHHDKVALAFALAALPFAQVGMRVSVDAIAVAMKRAWSGPAVDTGSPPMVSGMPLRLCQLTIAVGYCAAGMSKLVIGGLEWFNGYTLQGIMLGHDGAWSRTFASSVLLCQLQSIGAVAVQVLFPMVFVWPASRWFFLPAAAGFHLMTWKTMDTGPYMVLWLMLFAFVPMEAIPAALRRWLGAIGLRAVVTAVVGLAFATLVGGIAQVVVPLWALLAVALPLLAALALSLLRGARVQLLVDPARRAHRLAAACASGLDWGRCVETATEPAPDHRLALRTASGRLLRGAAAWAALAWRLPLLQPLWPLVALASIARPMRTRIRSA